MVACVESLYNIIFYIHIFTYVQVGRFTREKKRLAYVERSVPVYAYGNIQTGYIFLIIAHNNKKYKNIWTKKPEVRLRQFVGWCERNEH